MLPAPKRVRIEISRENQNVSNSRRRVLPAVPTDKTKKRHRQGSKF